MSDEMSNPPPPGFMMSLVARGLRDLTAPQTHRICCPILVLQQLRLVSRVR